MFRIPKIEVDIVQAEYDIIVKAAEKLGLNVQALMQQETDAATTGVSCWLQRSNC